MICVTVFNDRYEVVCLSWHDTIDIATRIALVWEQCGYIVLTEA